MKYSILFISDLHWGALNPERFREELNLTFIKFIEIHKKIDLVVFGGDYWNSKTSLNSMISILGINWMYEEFMSCMEEYGFITRVIVGTKSHDNDQMNVFKNLTSDRFKIIEENTLEETLPGLWALYCPDEIMSIEDYTIKYINNYSGIESINIGFFHGNFDVILSKNMPLETEIESMNSILYEYDFWSKLIKGPLIAGHWHKRRKIKELYISGSYSRFGFGEEEPKGFYYINYNTDNNSYYLKFIENKYAIMYKTFSIDTTVFNSMEYYVKLVSMIKDFMIDNEVSRVRILINITNTNENNDTYIQFIRDTFLNEKRIKITIKNKIKSETEKVNNLKRMELMEQFSFVDADDLTECQKIQECVKKRYDIDIPSDFLEDYIKKAKDKLK